MNLEHVSIHIPAWASHATTPQCQAECALEIHSHVNCHSTIVGPVPAEPERPSLDQVFWPQIWNFDVILVSGEHIAHRDLFVACCGFGQRAH